jgi:hypothetical protein
MKKIIVLIFVLAGFMGFGFANEIADCAQGEILKD